MTALLIGMNRKEVSMKLYRITLFAAIIALAACTKEVAPAPAAEAVVDGAKIIATAIAPGATISTKVNYTDAYSDIENITDVAAGAWSSGDSFSALEINGTAVTAVTFTASGSGASAEFKSSGAVEANENTQWIAVSGKARVENGILICEYDGQDGSLAKIGNYDFVMAKGSGTSPVFDFSAKEVKPLTYLMRLLLPAGIQYIEFNTGKEYNGGWNIGSDGKALATVSNPSKEAVRMLTLPSVSTAKQIAYLAIPAIDLKHETGTGNRFAGLIVTILSSDKRKSQGKVFSLNLNSKGGHMGTFDMSSLELMARPLASDAIRLGKVTYDGKDYPLGSWAPFNVGGDIPTSDEAIKGNLYAWGEIEPKATFSDANYKWKTGTNYQTTLGNKFIGAMEGVEPFIEVHYAGGKGFFTGPGTYYDIGGTKFDVARVKWGSEWRMPSNEVCCNLLKDSKYRLTDERDTQDLVTSDRYDAGTYTNSYKYKSTAFGVDTFKANGAELALYHVPFTEDKAVISNAARGRYWTSTTDYGNNPDASSGNYWNRAVHIRLDVYNGGVDNYINNMGWIWNGLSVRAVLNE